MDNNIHFIFLWNITADDELANKLIININGIVYLIYSSKSLSLLSDYSSTNAIYSSKQFKQLFSAMAFLILALISSMSLEWSFEFGE